MNIVYRKTLSDKRRVIVLDEECNNVSVLVKDADGLIRTKEVFSMWNWEEKLPKLLNVTKEELGL